jgi:hypothetical protein
MKYHIPASTRREILDHIAASTIGWSGNLQEVEFLGRLYDLKSITSTDTRYGDVVADIIHHRIVWHDWSYDWILTDPRFDLQGTSDEIFLRFLCETVHPAVRFNVYEALSLVDFFNHKLVEGGWRIIETEQIEGKPVFCYLRDDERSITGTN